MQVALRVAPGAASLSARALPLAAPSLLASAPRRGMASSRDVRMRVILRNDSELGSAHDVIAVRRGFGRKVLVRKGMADYATAENLHYSAVAKLAAKEAAMAAAAAGDATPQQQAAQQAAQGEVGEEARAAQSAAAATAAKMLLLSPEAARFAHDSVRRMNAQRPLLFVRPSGDLRDQTNLAMPLRLRDVYVKLITTHPSLTMRQLRFEGSAPDAITKFGDYKVLVTMTGAPQPVPVNISVKRDPTKVGAIPTAAVAAAAATAKPAAARA